MPFEQFCPLNELPGVHLIERLKIFGVGEKHRALDHVVESAAGVLKHRGDILERQAPGRCSGQCRSSQIGRSCCRRATTIK
jgi:hypothetical protein